MLVELLYPPLERCSAERNARPVGIARSQRFSNILPLHIHHFLELIPGRSIVDNLPSMAIVIHHLMAFMAGKSLNLKIRDTSHSPQGDESMPKSMKC